MKKFITATFLALCLVGSTVSVAFANPLTLRAENGIVMPPSGLNLDFGTNFTTPTATSTVNTPTLETQINYGAFPGLTVAAAFEAPLNVSDINAVQKMVKLYFSPIHDGRGYTLYLGYDFDKAQVPVYGISLWTNSSLLLGYVNLEARSANPGSTTVMITPGANLRIGSKLRMSGEIEVEPVNWKLGNFTLGASYALFPKVQLKVGAVAGVEMLTPQSYSLGLSATL